MYSERIALRTPSGATLTFTAVLRTTRETKVNEKPGNVMLTQSIVFFECSNNFQWITIII